MTDSKHFSETALSHKTAEQFLRAFSTAEVDAVLQSHGAFSSPNNWKPYGGAEKNWDRVGVQTSEAVGALAELIINSIDAILMRRAKEEKVEQQGAAAPGSMAEAVKRFFPEVIEGRLTSLSNAQRTALAEKSVLIGIQRKPKKTKYPNYTIVDFGEGQNHGDFEKTFLSLGEKNKEGIPFVQGRFNMGSTGSITFCTRAEIRSGMYKFILSKRNLSDSDGLWGWTLVRVRKVRAGEELPVVEYFCPGGEIPSFAAGEVRAFSNRGDIGVIKSGGSLVKLYEYDIGPGARTVDFGLRRALTTSLIECALPIRLYDFDAKPTKVGLRAEGITASTFAGMKTVMGGTDSDVADGEETADKFAFESVVENSENAGLGTIRIAFFGLNKMEKYWKDYPFRMFYTINGQSQAKERASLLRKAKLDDLRNHLIVQIDCNAMDNTARATVFKPDRERMAQVELTRELQEIVVNTLAEDRQLREFARTIRNRRISQQIEDEAGKNFLANLIKNTPDLQELFGAGGIIDTDDEKPGGGREYAGNKFPSHLTPKNLEAGNVKSVPINTYRWIECETDVQNDYLIRDADRGTFLHPGPDVLPNSGSLRNGKFRIKVSPPNGASVGDAVTVQFGFDDSNPARSKPLVFDATIKITAAEKRGVSPPGEPTDVRKTKKPALDFPNIEWVEQAGWDDHGYDENSGGHATIGERFTVYVNRANKYLSALLAKESDDGKREIILHRFRFGLGILTLALYKKLVHDAENAEAVEQYDADYVLRLATSAIAAHVVTLIDRLGGDK